VLRDIEQSKKCARLAYFYFAIYIKGVSMSFSQKVIPAIGSHQDLKTFLSLDLEYGILMNFQLAQLEELVLAIKKVNKKVLIHSELIKGLSSDEFGAIYLIQNLKVDGIISSKPKVIEICKKRGVIGIFRFFLKDTLSLEQSLEITKSIKPDYLEILPALSFELIDEIKNKVNTQILMGGLIKDESHIKRCLSHGAIAVTTSNKAFWK
jgi:glycerol uptake operon antiterminator